LDTSTTGAVLRTVDHLATGMTTGMTTGHHHGEQMQGLCRLIVKIYQKSMAR